MSEQTARVVCFLLERQAIALVPDVIQSDRAELVELQFATQMSDVRSKRIARRAELLIIPNVPVQFFGRERLVEIIDERQEQLAFDRRQLDHLVVHDQPPLCRI